MKTKTNVKAGIRIVH